ncbi:hypothetical protein HD554DRAFT_2101937 [Boletus coccyginus]|nr:hypothetical protein HD554DRAFT_2101937 [Boletus coccyginus]
MRHAHQRCQHGHPNWVRPSTHHNARPPPFPSQWASQLTAQRAVRCPVRTRDTQRPFTLSIRSDNPTRCPLLSTTWTRRPYARKVPPLQSQLPASRRWCTCRHSHPNGCDDPTSNAPPVAQHGTHAMCAPVTNPPPTLAQLPRILPIFLGKPIEEISLLARSFHGQKSARVHISTTCMHMKI